MTTTVKRGAGRPAAQNRSSRHAQRTPLPPKPGQVGDAKEVLSAAYPRGDAADATERAEQYGTMSVAELRARAKELEIKGISRAKHGELMTMILIAERAAEIEAAQAEQDAIPQDEDSPGGAYAPVSDSKSLAKAERLRTEVAPHGWELAVLGIEGGAEAVLKRGDEAMHIAWLGGVFQYESATYTYADRVTKIRNVSQARQMAARPAAEAAQVFAKVASNKAWKKKAPDAASRRVALPFDPTKARDLEVIEALVGKTVKWHNRLSGNDEQALVISDPRRVEVQAVGDDRVVKFLCPHSGFRAFRLADLLGVGGSRKKS